MGNYFLYQSHKIHYSDNGEGSVVVLLHGYLESSEVWNGFAEKLALTFRVISIDLPGHGLSDVFGETHSMEFMASVVKELIKSLGIEKIFLTGHSLGGYVALAFLELYPETLTGYCLSHSHPFADSQQVLEKREREIKIVREGKKYMMYPDNVTRMYADSNIGRFAKALEKLKHIASQIPGDGIIAVLNGMMIRPSRLSVMEEGRVPCLWILGEMDNYIDYEQMLKKVRLPGNAEVIILEDSGHLGFIKEEKNSLNLINNFISRRSR